MLIKKLSSAIPSTLTPEQRNAEALERIAVSLESIADILAKCSGGTARVRVDARFEPESEYGSTLLNRIREAIEETALRKGSTAEPVRRSGDF